jgi:hypothetical protein
MNLLMITWTDIFEGTGAFFTWAFQGMRALGHLPNFFFGALTIFGISYWIWRLLRYKGLSQRNSTVE